MKKFFGLLWLFLILTACGGGGGSSSATNTNASANNSGTPEGIWTGKFHSNVTGYDYAAQGMVTGNLNSVFTAWWQSPQAGTGEAVYSGNIGTSGDNLSATLTGYAPSGFSFPNKTSVSNVSISGTFTQFSTAQGTYSGGGDNGTFSLNYQTALYEQPASISIVNGTWSDAGGPVGAVVHTVIVDSTGKITGGDTTGCIYSGNVNIPNSSRNIYSVNMGISNCPESGSYAGLAYYNNSGGSKSFTYAISGNAGAMAGILYRQ